MKKAAKKTTKLTKTQKVERLKKLLVKACNTHIKAGGKVVSGTFHNKKGCCPIYCATKTDGDGNFRLALEEKLGFKLTDINLFDFMSGFDYPSTSGTWKTNAETKLGQALRKKYVKEKK